MTVVNPMPRFSATELEEAFRAFAPLTQVRARRSTLQPYPAERVAKAFERLAEPLARARLQGQLINPWKIAGLKRDELRTAEALAGLWMIEFGGEASRRFLGDCLSACIETVDWNSELASGYRVAREVSPLGARSDRVDLTIETAGHVIGIEVKINAQLGERQLERYVQAIATRAEWRNATGHVVFLSPFASGRADVAQLFWSTVCDVAEAAVAPKASARSVVEQLIVSFGQYVKGF